MAHEDFTPNFTSNDTPLSLEVVHSSSWIEARSSLARPIWPLCHLTTLLYLTGPFERVEETVAALPSPVETANLTYPTPRAAIEPFVDLLRPLHQLKGSADMTDLNHGPCFTVDGEPLDPWDRLMALVQQRVLERELEGINSLLCGPCRCTLCCTGPEARARQEFFEIPLTDTESRLFDLSRVDTPASRSSTAQTEPELKVHGRPFYREPQGLYRWANGWSLILPRDARCPHLRPEGTCAIYAERPHVCRRPQIFAMVLEKAYDADTTYPGPGVQVRRESLLAVWDCPYVKTLREEIVRYAELTGLAMVFRENKE